MTTALRRVSRRARHWSWRVLHRLWWLCWWLTESTVPVPAHWRKWWSLGYWLYHRKESTVPSLIENARPGEHFCCSRCGYVRDGQVGPSHVGRVP